MTEQQQSFAIVVGIDTMQGLQTARILAAHNIPVIAFAANLRHHACRTKVCREIRHVDTNTESVIEALRSLGPTLLAKAVLFPCHDQCVWLISRHRASLTNWYHIMLAEAPVIEMLMDKPRFYDVASKLSISVPRTFTLKSQRDAEEIANDIQYPCVIKPVQRGPQWNAKTMAKAFRVENTTEFLAIYQKVSGWAPELMAQEGIVGSDADLYSCNCYFDRQGKLVASFVARKLRQWPPRMGSSCLGEECRNDTVLDATVRIFKEIGYSGLGYIEMKRDVRTGEHFAIEANLGRPTGRSAIAEAGGVDMLYAMYCDAIGAELPQNLDQKYLGVKWLDLRHDIQSAFHYFRKGELTVGDWYRSLRGRKAHAVFSLRDPMPFIADWWRAICTACSRKERALRAPVIPPVNSSTAPPNTGKKEKL